MNFDARSLAGDAGLLQQFPTMAAVAETAAKDADAATEAIAGTRDDLVMNTAATLSGAEVDGRPADRAEAQSLNTGASGAVDVLKTPPPAAASRLAEPAPNGTAADPAHPHLAIGSKASRPENGPIAFDEESADATRPIPASNLAKPFAAGDVIANSTAPHRQASGSPRPVAPQADTFSALPHGASGMVDASTTRATLLTPQSEIAFQAEIQLNTSQSASEAPVSNPQRDALARWTTHNPREGMSANTAANRPQQSESKAPGTETVQTIDFRRTGDHSDAGGSSLGQDHPSGNLDRGTQQTTPLSHEPSLTASKPAADGALSSRPSATPAAAQLDGAAPVTPPETGHAVRSVALKIQSEDGAANVVLTDRGGQVHVTVRSSDPALAHSLRSDLGSLAGGLRQHGFDVKLWTSPPGPAADAEARGNSSEQSGQDDFRGQTRQRHSPDDAENRNRRQSEWNEEFD